MIAREASKSDFFAIFCKRRRKITLWSRSRSYCITPNRDIIYLPATAFFACRELSFCFPFVSSFCPFCLQIWGHQLSKRLPRQSRFPVNYVELFRTQTYGGIKYCQFSDSLTRKWVFLQTFKNSQKNTCAGASSLIQLKAWGQKLDIEKVTPTQVF